MSARQTLYSLCPHRLSDFAGNRRGMTHYTISASRSWYNASAVKSQESIALVLYI